MSKSYAVSLTTNSGGTLMKRTKIAHSLRFLLSAGLLVVLCAGSLPIFAAFANKGKAAEILVSGTGEDGAKPFLKLNGEPVLSGRTFFSYSTLETPQSVSADVNLPGLGRVSLSPGTMLSLGFSENSITGKLHAGKIRVFSTAGTTVNIETPDNRLVNDSTVPGTFTLDMTSGVSKAISESGAAFLNNGEPAGQVQTAPATASILVPSLILAGAVGTAVVVVLLDRSSDEDRAEDAILSPVR
jgi:hypothetical protein